MARRRAGRWSTPPRAVGRVLNPLRRLGGRHRAGEEGSAFAFTVRLLVTVAITFTVVGVAGYVLLERNLAHRQIGDYAAALRADVKAFEHEGARGISPADALLRVDPLLDAIEHRSGTKEAVLIDQHHVVVQALNDAQVGKVEADAGINGALENGSSFVGRDSGAGSDTRDFQFVSPVTLLAGHYAYEVTYDHHVCDAQVSEVRMILLLVGLIALFGGGAVFYLVGGRRLMRDHRMALRRATRDGLTDLPNQRAFQDELRQAVGSAARYEDPFALALLDVDNFKLVNDRHGHPYGDAILKRVAAVLREARPGDRPYRIGGDEFALMLAHTDAEGARILARRLSQQLEAAGVETSIGVSALHPGVHADELRGEADAALYEAKRQGGSRVAHFDDIRERVFVTTSEKKEAVQRLIADGRLSTVFQPVWDLGAESLLGVEALTRPDASYGLSGPAEALPSPSRSDGCISSMSCASSTRLNRCPSSSRG
jgi:diguanylate cyclase (GGDEF)-like protein